MHVAALEIEIHIPLARSLKAKRSVVKHLVESARGRFGVAAAEVAHQEQWQRSGLGFSIVSSSPAQVERVLDEVEKFIWSHPEIEVVSSIRNWLDTDQAAD